MLTACMNGQNTLRDLSNKFKQPIISFAKSMLPYVSKKVLGFIEIPDLIENASNSSL